MTHKLSSYSTHSSDPRVLLAKHLVALIYFSLPIGQNKIDLRRGRGYPRATIARSPLTLVPCWHLVLRAQLQERADTHMAAIEKRLAEEGEAAALRDPAIAMAAEEAALKAAVQAAAEADAALAAAAAPMTGAQIREDAMRRARAKKKPNPNNDQKLEEIRKVVGDAQEAMLARDLHPFSRWKVRGAYAVGPLNTRPRETGALFPQDRSAMGNLSLLLLGQRRGGSMASVLFRGRLSCVCVVCSSR